MKEGEEIVVVDGKGNRFRCVITDAHQKHTGVEIVSKEEAANHWAYPITLAVAPTKLSDRMEWMLEKAVEMGIDRIVLLKCRHSERKVMKLERLEKVMISAMKQSLKGVLPVIEDMTDFRKFVKDNSASGQLFFGYCDAAYPRKEFAKECRPAEPVVIMIGPEGDFSPEEVEFAVKNGFRPVTFGKSRLRTETAALYAVAAVHVINQLSE